MAQASSSPKLPEVPGYRILAVLGEGGMGRVYLGEDTALGRRAAIKLVSERIAASPEARARFLREARSLAAVEHPNVVRVYGFGETAGVPYLVMEHVEGESLAERLSRGRALPAREAVRIAREVAEALQAAWEKGVVHRDIKPSNVLIDRKGRVRVADFGLAKVLADDTDAEVTRDGRIVGSPHYMAPEQARGEKLDFRADVYALGVVLFEMLAGRRPFEGATPLEVVSKRLHEEPPPVRGVNPDVPEDLAALVADMTRRDVARRPDSYVTLIRRLRSAAGEADEEPTRTSLEAGAPSTTERRSWSALSAAGLLLAAAAWSAYCWVGILRDGRGEAGDGRRTLAVAVAPFHGPDADSLKEGRVMAALVEREVSRRLGPLGASVLGPDATRDPVRDHAAARALGERLGASVVIWGDAFVLRGETEIQPSFTLVPARRRGRDEGAADRARQLAELGERTAGALVVGAEATNQIELRRTSAAGVGDLALVLAGVHALYLEGDAKKALAFFEKAPRSPESVRYRAEAEERLKRPEEAAALAREAAALDPRDPQTQALLGDLSLAAGRLQEAVQAYRRSSEAEVVRSRRGFLLDDRLYVRETFRSQTYTKGEEQDTGFLLGLDPSTGRVLERHRLPGVALGFARRAREVEITYSLLMDPNGPRASIRFARGGFDRPVYYGDKLLLRRMGVNSGWALAANFSPGPELRVFLPTGERDGAPRSLAELETALRAARERDPTQPWHVFFLGQCAWAQGRKSEAKELWGRLLAAPYAGTPYYESSYMAVLFERLGQRGWADRVFAAALEQRKAIVQPIGWTTALERMISLPFVQRRWTAGVPPERAFDWWSQGFEIAGHSGEGDAATAALWSAHFEARGDRARAERARALAREARAFPMSYDRQLAGLDLALNALACATLAFWSCALVLVLRGRPWRPLRAALALSAPRSRFLAGAFALSLVPLPPAILYAHRVVRFAEMYLISADSLGSAQSVRIIDQRLETIDTPATHYAAAVIHHLAGDRERALELYATLSDERVSRNREALERGELRPPVPLTASEYLAAWLARPLGEWAGFAPAFFAHVVRATGRVVDLVTPACLVNLVLGASILVALATASAVPSAPSTTAVPPASRAGRLTGLLVPGFLDLRRGRLWRGYFAICGTLLLVLVVLVQLLAGGEWPVLGLLSARLRFGVFRAYPLPPQYSPDAGASSLPARLIVLREQPGAEPFLAIVGLAAVVALGLHLRALREAKSAPASPSAPAPPHPTRG